MTRILVIEDSDGQRAEIRTALEASRLFAQVIEAHDGIQGLKSLLSDDPDMVLCDLEMPGLDGEKLLRMSAEASRPDRIVPFLVLTAVTDQERRARLLEHGASDAITKPFHTADLIARIGLHLKLVQTQKELMERNAELRRMSRTDVLTGLNNRRALDDALEAEFKRARRYGQAFAVAIGDVDHFKGVNDEHGHAVGDEILCRVAGTMNSVVRETDFGGRFGGEEFLAILRNNDASGASIFAERWRAAVEMAKTELDGGGVITTTMSVGVAEWTPDDSAPDQVVRRADEALYQAKETGRNRVNVYAGR